MCYSLLQVTFRNDKARETKECASEADERSKIEELRGKDQVARIAVFRCQRHVTRKEVWDESPYAPPVLNEILPKVAARTTDEGEG